MVRLVLSVLIISAISVFGDKHIKKDRIIGGNDTPIEHYPYMISLHYNGKFFCGGAIIAVNRILTAASCVQGLDKAHLSIRAGSSAYNSGGVEINVEEVYIHPENNFIDFDVAVLVLKTNLTLSAVSKIAKLRDCAKDLEPGTEATISGWGLISTKPSIKPPVSETLQGATVEIIKLEDCVEAYKHRYIVNDRMICASAPGKDACKGDGGGTMVDLDGNIIGVISWGIDCANPKFPGVNADICNKKIHKFVSDKLV